MNVRISATSLKEKLPPELYYGAHLEGSIGKSTGQGWHGWNGLCPFHNDRRKGSLYINKVTGGFYCFSCGAKGGDILNFHQDRYGLSFRETLSQLGEVLHA